MNILIERVNERLMNSGWFLADGTVPSMTSNGTLKVHRLQTGVQRISCLDSLDRTNICCSLFAHHILSHQIQSMIASAGTDEQLDISGKSIRSLTNLWADSGDAISLLYAGTRALKSDVTRTGERQWIRGSFDDTLNSLTRYYLNNVSSMILRGVSDEVFLALMTSDLVCGWPSTGCLRHLVRQGGVGSAGPANEASPSHPPADRC